MGLVDKMAMLQALSAEWSIKPVVFEEIQVQRDVAKLIPDAVAREKLFHPVHQRRRLCLGGHGRPSGPSAFGRNPNEDGGRSASASSPCPPIFKLGRRGTGTQMADDEAPMSEQQLDDVAEEKTREIMESRSGIPTRWRRSKKRPISWRSRRVRARSGTDHQRDDLVRDSAEGVRYSH